MTHHTEAERADFEAAIVDEQARILGGANKSYLASVWLVRDGYTYRQPTVRTAWVIWQAARRAPAVPVPQGWKMVPVEPTREMIDAMPPVEETGYWAMYEAALAAAPQPPEAAQSNSAEFEGIKPDAFQTEGGLKSEIRTTSTAPVQMPEPAGCVVYANGESHHWDANKECAELFASSERSRGAPYAFTFENLYTEQQVRELLAAHGIQEQST